MKISVAGEHMLLPTNQSLCSGDAVRRHVLSLPVLHLQFLLHLLPRALIAVLNTLTLLQILLFWAGDEQHAE